MSASKLFFNAFLPGRTTSKLKLVIKNGPIVGEIITLPGVQQKAAVFRGVPFAKPPVGALRFKKPQPLSEWRNPIDCTDWAPICVQFRPVPEIGQTKPDSEDCLYLNVFTPAHCLEHASERMTEKCPILLFIHGGWNTSGGAMKAGLDNLILAYVQHGICVVTVQYRLGPLGFACTDDGLLNGNLALWDLTQVLKWVHENAAFFGADEQRITLAGWSAGSRMITLLDQSPHSTDLFHQMIMFSGSGVRLAPQSSVIRNIKKLSELLDPSQEQSSTESQLVDKLQNEPVQNLQTAFMEIVNTNSIDPSSPLWPLGPICDGEFLQDIPAKTLSQKQRKPKAAIIGTMKRELTAALFTAPDPMTIAHLRQCFEYVFGTDSALNQAAEQHYMQAATTEAEDLMEIYLKFWSDVYYNGPIHNEVKLRSKRGVPIFVYEMNYVSDWKFPDSTPQRFKSSHGEEQKFVFGLAQQHHITDEVRQLNHEEKLISEQWQAYVRNFVKHGNPNDPDDQWAMWKTATPAKQEYLEIQENPSMRELYCSEQAEFWTLDHFLKF